MTNVYFVNHPWHEAGGFSGGCDGLFHLLSPPLCPRQLRVCQVVCNCLDLCLKNLENKLHVIVQFILTRDFFQCETIPEREKKCQRYISDDSGRRYRIFDYFVPFLFLVTLRFYMLLVDSPLLLSLVVVLLGAKGILYHHHQNCTTSTFHPSYIHLLALKLSLLI